MSVRYASGMRWDRSTRGEPIEPGVESNTKHVLDNSTVHRDRTKRAGTRNGVVGRSEIDVQILESRGPVVPERPLDAGAGRPTHRGRLGGAGDAPRPPRGEI